MVLAIMENELTSESVIAKLTLLTYDIKTETDQPEFVNKTDLLPENCIKKEDAEENLESSASNERFSCRQCNEEFPDFKYVEVHEAVHDSKLHCPVCHRIFKLEKYFVPHIQVHLKDPLKCQECPEIFFDKRSYNLHSYAHKKVKSYTCEYCLKEWSNKKDLTLHIRVHTNERPFSCAVCGRSFKQKGALTAHIFSLHSEEKKIAKEKFNCEICNGSYSSVSSLNKHMKHIHETGKTFSCRNCGETFLNFRQMKEHRRQTHPELVYNRICPFCNQKFACRETFAKHQLIHPEAGQQIDENPSGTPIDCYLCGEKTDGIRAFSKHQQVHLLMTEEEIDECTRAKRFICKVCKRQFCYKKNLFRHMDVHLEKAFDCGSHCSGKFTYLGFRLHFEWHLEQLHCTQCNEVYIGKKNLKKHYKKQHQKMVAFPCKICGYKFRYRRLLITHYKLQHKLKCHLCSKNFVTHLELKRHIEFKHKVKCEASVPIPPTYVDRKVTITPARKYNCKVCKFSVNTAHLLRDHQKIHRKKCFQCENCKKHFLHFSNWMFHMRQNICLKYFDNTNGMTHLSCFACKKEFETVHSLLDHMRRHSTIRTCKFCKSKFKQRDLQEHINRQHPEEVKYSCDKCSLRFCSFIDLIRHGKYSHRYAFVKEEPFRDTLEPSHDTESIQIDENIIKPDEHELISIKEEFY